MRTFRSKWNLVRNSPSASPAHWVCSHLTDGRKLCLLYLVKSLFSLSTPSDELQTGTKSALGVQEVYWGKHMWDITGRSGQGELARPQVRLLCKERGKEGGLAGQGLRPQCSSQKASVGSSLSVRGTPCQGQKAGLRGPGRARMLGRKSPGQARSGHIQTMTSATGALR